MTESTTDIPGYAYGSPEVGRSPVSLAELDDLKRAIGFDEADERYLRMAGEVLADQLDELFETWTGLIGHYFAPTFAGPDGKPDEAYAARAHARFVRWVEDTCMRPYDQDWLDYQHEIALRHHRAKKNRTDGVASPVEHVPYRYLPVTLHPLTQTVPPFLARKGASVEDVDGMARAWTKSLILQVTLWSHPYVKDGDW